MIRDGRKWAVILLLSFTQAACAARDSWVVARVGDTAITHRMAEQRERVAKLYYPDERARVGVSQLVHAYTAAEILRRHGVAVDRASLERESARIEAQTRNPNQLARIKHSLDDDHEAYLNVFVLPVLAERVAFGELYPRKFRAPAEDFYGEAKARPDLMASRTRAAGAELLVRKFGARELAALKWPLEAVQETKRGQVYRKLVPQDDRLWVVRYLGTSAGVSTFEVASFPLSTFAEWFEDERKSVSVSWN